MSWPQDQVTLVFLEGAVAVVLLVRDEIAEVSRPQRTAPFPWGARVHAKNHRQSVLEGANMCSISTLGGAPTEDRTKEMKIKTQKRFATGQRLEAFSKTLAW